MKKTKTLVQAKHIEKGIEKYQGQLSPKIQKHLDNVNWNYKAYLFKDLRVLLVYPDNSFAILYASEESLYRDMEKELNINNNSIDSV